MRTKVEKNHKKAAEQKFNISLPSPKVVLNANDCARLLDGMGKTSVLLVEKEGKMVAAAEATRPSHQSSVASSVAVTPSTSSSLSSSLPSSGRISSAPGAANQTKICKNSVSLCASKSNRQRESSETADSCSGNSGSLNNAKESQDSPAQTKAILKPPKKRRGMDKKFETLMPTPSVINNGEIIQAAVSPLRESGACSGHRETDAASAPAQVHTAQKHSVESLLQPKPGSSFSASNSNNNTLISGNFSHHLCDSRTPHIPQADLPSSSLSNSPFTSSSSVANNGEDYLGKVPYHLTLSQPTSQVYSHSFSSSSQQPPHNHSLSASTSGEASQHHTYHKQNSSGEPSSSLPLPLLIPTSQTVACTSSFQQLPEQLEPMNLSKSGKSDQGLGTIDTSTAARVSPTAEDQAVISSSSLNPDVVISARSEAVLQVVDRKKSENKKLKKKPPKTSQMAGPEVVTSSDIQTTDHFGHNGEAESVVLEENRLKGKNHSAATQQSAGSELTESSPSQIQESAVTVTVPHNQSSAVPCPVNVQVQQQEMAAEKSVEHHSHFPVSAKREALLPSSSSSQPSSTVSLSLPSTLSQSSENSSSLPIHAGSEQVQTNDHPPEAEPHAVASTGSETDVTLKSKKASKKKVEIPMDEAACASRVARYLVTIEDVIANFVYTPEPIEEFTLTEEEEAAIKEQFQNAHENSNKEESSTGTRDADGGVDNVGHGGGDTDEERTMTVKGTSALHPEAPNTAIPPKKRPTPVTVDNHVDASSQDLGKTVQNIDSVLAFVAADVSNSEPPMHSALNEDKSIKTHKKITKKVKPAGDVGQNQDVENKKKKKTKKLAGKEKAASVKDMQASAAGSKDSEPAVNQVDVTAVEVVSSDDKISTGAKKISKPKKAKKRKANAEEPTQSDQHFVAGEKIAESALPDEELTPAKKKKKKKVDANGKTPKKKKSEAKSTSQLAESVPRQPGLTSDKDIVSSSRAETSDIGESIASTSGGSEQDTPVHEPETKDEMTSTDPQIVDKENHDTGLESGGEDNKPVRRYKKRLDFVKCDQCDHQARGRSALSRHMKKVHMMDVNMPYKCEHCEYGCTKMASLNRHLFTHGVYPCSRCTFVSDDRAKLTQHVMEFHKDKLDMKLCKICNRYIKCDTKTIEQHTEECQGPIPFKCTECEKEFKYASSLRVHYHTHFPDQPKRFKCEQCDYRTNYKANLHKHHKNMHASRDRDVQCPDCGKLFSTEDNMRRHRKVHTLARPFACDVCKKTFKTSGALKGHQLIHTATRPYTCNIPGCNRSFRTPKFLKSHQEEFHRLVPKKFFCTVEGCNYSFFKRSHLKRHAVTHTGERNFHCTWPGCSKSFRHADNLKVHFRSHTNEKPVQCHLCDFKCKQKNSLFWHKKKVHQIIDVSVCPKRLEHKFKVAEQESDQDKKENASTQAGDIIQPSHATQASQTPLSDTAEETIKKTDDISNESKLEEKSGAPVGEETSGVAYPAVTGPKEHSMGTQTLLSEDDAETGPRDLYEFKSDEESEEESPGNFRRDKISMNVLTPLPPPPKELLRKNEIQEMKEKEKKEKAEKKEQERKEKAEKKEQEKKERAEKKEQEKKEKAEKREQEKREKAEKKEQEKKEKLEKKEQEKREKEEKRLALKAVKKKTPKKNETTKSEEHGEEADQNTTKVSPKASKRKKSPAPAVKEEPVIEADKPKRGRKKKSTEGAARDKSKEPADDATKKEVQDPDVSPPKRKKLSPKKGGGAETSPASALSPRSATARSPATPTAKKSSLGKGKKKGKVVPPKRKPSARIKARKKAKAKKAKVAAKGQKSPKPGQKKKPGRKKAVIKKKEEHTEDTTEVEQKEPEEAKPETEKDSLSGEGGEEKSKPKPGQEELPTLPQKPSSPAYSEEIMLQGKASPYRDFSDAENLEEEGTEEKEKMKKPRTSRKGEEARSPNIQEAQEITKTETELPQSEKLENEASDKLAAQPAEESSDDEVSNDIPLTPPRAPAPPPVESSEDEMEPEPEPTPFSVPAPNTPFSVPGPNTPFSVPPPTNLMQQHSVHSEEAPMSAVPSVPSMEMHSQGSVEMQQSLGSVEMHPHGSVEMNHPQGSVEMHHPQGSVEISHSHSSGEMHSHNTSGDLHPHEMRAHGSVEMRSHGSVEMAQPHGSVEMQHPHGSIPEPIPQREPHMTSVRTPESGMRDSKYDLEQSQGTEADKEYFDQYLKSLSAANNRAANGGMEPSPSGLQQLEAMVGKSHQDGRELSSRSPISSLPTSVITSLESALPILPPGDLRARMDALVSDRHHDSLCPRDTPSSLPRLPDRQAATPLPPTPAAPTPAFDAFSLNSLHPAAPAGGRENSYLRQSENLFPPPPVTSSFMAEAMFQRQAMSTPFLPPQPADRNSLSRIPDTTPLRSSSSSSLLRRPGAVPGSDMFASPSMPQAMPRHPFANAWASQDVRPTHWQNPYLPRQPNMATTGPFFPTKENYLTGREFMFDPSVRPSTERGMFPSLSSSQSQDSFQLERFDLSNYFPNAMTPYGSSTGTLDYSRSAHSAATKPFDDRYRQTAAASAAAIPEFRALPPTTGSTDMFSGLPGVNTGFNLYTGSPMSYHTQHMTDNVNSAFLTHSTSAQHAMFERDYAAAAAHRGLYPQNTPYPFIDERQYTGASKLAHSHPVAPTPAPQERDLMSRSAAPENQMQDPYRSMLYRY